LSGINSNGGTLSHVLKPQLVGAVANPTAGVMCEFQGGRVHSFQWGILDTAGPELPALADPAGDSTATAVLDLQKTESQRFKR
jgi:hypothetical protein